jgi:hypothetical protein
LEGKREGLEGEGSEVEWTEHQSSGDSSLHCRYFTDFNSFSNLLTYNENVISIDSLYFCIPMVYISGWYRFLDGINFQSIDMWL